MGIAERRERERSHRRKAVLEAARVLMRERGYNGTTTREIAAACELSEATVFWYFQSKDEIFTALLLEGIDFMETRIEILAATKWPPGELLEQLWTLFGELRAEHPEYFHVFAHLADPDATVSVSAELREELALRSGENFRRVADLIVPAVGQANARAAADLLWAAFVGLCVLGDSRANLGVTPHPTASERAQAFDLLLSAMTH